MPSPNATGITAASRPDPIQNAADTSPRSMAAAATRVTIPTSVVSSSTGGRRISRWATRSSASSSRSVTAVSRRPMSVISPTPCSVMAARTSGASAIRSTSICTLGLVRSSAQTRSATSESSALITWSATSSLARARSTAFSIARWTVPSSSPRSSARSTAGLRMARTMASSTASSTALSTPVAPASRSAPRAPASSRRAGAERLWSGGSISIRG